MMNICERMKELRSREEIPAFLFANGLRNRICEVGVRYGSNLERLLACKPKEAFGVDHYKDTGIPSEQDIGTTQDKLDEIYGRVLARFRSSPNVRILRQRSEIAARTFEDGYFDFIYIDADHSKKGCYRDIRAWWPKVRKGGILAGHDYQRMTSRAGTEFGVIEAVAQFRSELRMTGKGFHVTPEKNGPSWLIYRPIFPLAPL